MLLSNVRKRLPIFWKAGLDWLYPPCCPLCGQPDVALCLACATDLAAVQWEAIPRPLPYLDGAFASGEHSGLLREGIHALKFGCERVLAEPLGERIWQVLKFQGESFDTVIPVPLHESRFLERGFNQAELLGLTLSELAAIPLNVNALRRNRATQTQVGLDEKQRLRNVANAFQVMEEVIDQRILLVDDVCTSGATLVACARALRRAGAETISALTVSTTGENAATVERKGFT